MSIRGSVLTFILLACASIAQSANPQTKEPAFHVYAVICGVTMGADAKIQEFRVAKVIEPLTGSNNAVQVELPKGYVDAAKKQAEAAHLTPMLKDGKPSETFMVFLHTPLVQPTAAAEIPLMSLGSLDGALADITNIQLLGRAGQASLFGKPLGRFALFFTYYAIPLPKDSKEEREAAINAEIERCLKNIPGAEVVSRKAEPMPDQSIVEVMARTPRSKTLSIRFRVICSPRHLLALTATTPDNLDAESKEALEKMFEDFHFYFNGTPSS